MQLPGFKIAKPIIFSIPNQRIPAKSSRSLVLKAIKEWRKYEDAVREKVLARALRFLKTMETVPNHLQTPASTSLPYAPSNHSLPYMLDLPRLE
ncbi:hypothetical protein MA16_Dca022003 [Dendrobium catenatum]|uniref:Uncharacterized protein n=1 Tax=Dendrobium catenatum TaxID=906689 RepID=A0A2I0X9X1_9ASPA|nr:hypothetical protein MA16_Dca022003 [Dendrobium catenatum]